MSPSLPPEILDLVIDHLHDEPTTLKTCCVVSKSWIPRAQKHLFARVEFHASKSHMELWKQTFPDPSNSPAHHTRSLSIYGNPVATATDVSVDNWIRAFHNVVHLRLERLDRTSLVPFHGLSPDVRSLRLSYTTPEIFGLVCSFPSLKHLALVALHPESDADGWNTPLTSPKLTGSLDLRMFGSARPVIRRLLDLPDGLHFSKITMLFVNNDTESVTKLVSRCSDTLEFLVVLCLPLNTSRTLLLDLSKATKLKYLKFLWTRSSVQWIATTLQTVKSKNLQRIIICQAIALPEEIEEAVYREWQDLDRLLVQFWASHLIRPRVTYVVGKGGKDLRDHVPSLLPELTRRGLVDLV